MSSPTENSLKLLRRNGWECAITERWNPFAKVRQDLFGFCDILCLGHGKIVAIQTTTLKNAPARIKKILNEPRAMLFLDSGGVINVHGWAKIGPRGEKKVLTCRLFPIPPTGNCFIDEVL